MFLLDVLSLWLWWFCCGMFTSYPFFFSLFDCLSLFVCFELGVHAFDLVLVICTGYSDWILCCCFSVLLLILLFYFEFVACYFDLFTLNLCACDFAVWFICFLLLIVVGFAWVSFVGYCNVFVNMVCVLCGYCFVSVFCCLFV